MALWKWLPRARKATCLAPPSQGTARERRAMARYRCRLNCYYSPITLGPKGPPGMARVRDLSADGIRLEAVHPLPPGTFIALSLQTLPGQFMRQLRARVIRLSRAVHNDRWIVGCHLTTELSEQELDALL